MFHRISQNKGHEIFDLLVAHRSKEELEVITEALNQSTAKDPSEGDTLPVLYAFPDLKLVRKMVDFGTNMKRLNLLKCMKAYRGDKPVVQTLLEFGLDPNVEWEGQTPLWWAHEEGKTDLISLLCKAGSQLELQNKVGRTLLLEACLKGTIAEVRILLRHGAALSPAAEDLALTDYPGKGEDTKTQLVELLRGWKPQTNA
jgi:ankyrin repeat protein